MFKIFSILSIFLALTSCAQEKKTNNNLKNNNIMNNFNPLSEEEQNVILKKGTELPNTGEYNKNKQEGTYLCKQCNNPLYRSIDKFESSCGWPSFDDEIKGAVTRKTDADGSRTEIICANCGAHLGHVFNGEGFTNKNIRHCVNSVSLRFIPQIINSIPERAIIAGGCFWGVEYYFSKEPGVISTTVGYINGKTENPTYEEVCLHTTGHAEAVEIFFDPKKTTYEKLLKLFFELHDFTQVNGQGPDIGEQYRSAIFYLNNEQKQIADSLIKLLSNKGYKVATEVTSAKVFWNAEKYHQDYYDNKGGTPYCHARKNIF